jgi:hypothetical protein
VAKRFGQPEISPALGMGEDHQPSHLQRNGPMGLPRTRPAKRLPGSQLQSGLDLLNCGRAARLVAWRGHPSTDLVLRIPQALARQDRCCAP